MKITNLNDIKSSKIGNAQICRKWVTMPLLHERLKEMRIKRGYTQEHMAKALGKLLKTGPYADRKKYNISHQSYGMWETGKVLPSAEIVSALARILDVTSDYLLSLVDDENSMLLEEGMSDRERMLIFRIRQNEEAQRLVANMLELPDTPLRLALVDKNPDKDDTTRTDKAI